MPFMKNAEGKIALVLETEVDALKKAGFKLLSEAEELAHREELNLKPELTSAAAQDEARVKAGVADALNGEVAKVEQTVAKAGKPKKDAKNAA